MIFDTDVFIWVQRGNLRAASMIQNAPTRCISLQTYLELMQGATDKQQQHNTRKFLLDFGFQTLPLTPEVGSRAATLVETYALSHNMRAGDALIAATAIANNQPLCTSNIKHYRQIPLLELIRLTVN